MVGELQKRVYKGISANIITQLTSLVIQFMSIPVFLHFWGVELYGQWILLYSVPAYLSFADMGFGTTSSTLIAKSLSRQDYKDALRIFQSTLFLTGSVGLLLVLLSVAAVQVVSVKSLLNIHSFSSAEVTATIIVLTLYVVINQQQGILNGIYNYNNRFHFIANINSAARLLEFVFVVIAVVSTKSVFYVSLSMLLTKIVQVLFVVNNSIKLSPWIKLGIAHRDHQFIKSQWRPSLSLLLYPVSFAILNQGVSVLIGRSLGNPALVLFNTVRTLVNSIKTFASQINNLLFAELVKFFAFNETASAKVFYAKTVRNTSLFILASGTALVFFGPLFIHKWTNRALLPVSYAYVAFFIAEAVTYNLWHANYQTYLAQNRHTRLTVVFLFSALLTVMASSLFLPLYGAAAFLLTASFANCLLYFFTVKNLFA